MEQVRLWVTDDTGSATPLAIRERFDLESRFEDLLAQTPDMLGEGVALVGRQLQTASGPLDLLGIDQDGKLVVYELKRGQAPREALTQAVDYASWLDSLEIDELARRISEHRPRGFERGFDDFGDWYEEQYAEDQAEQLRPTRIVLVGMGMEPAAQRMAHWLADKGVDIGVVTFHAFEHEERVVLARQVEVSAEDAAAPAPPDPECRAKKLGAIEVYLAARKFVAACFVDSPHMVRTLKRGVNFTLPPTDDRRRRGNTAYVGVIVSEDAYGKAYVVIRRAGLAACPEALEQLRNGLQDLGLRFTSSRTNFWIPLDTAELERAKPLIADFTKAAVAAWERQWQAWNAESPAATDNGQDRSTP